MIGHLGGTIRVRTFFFEDFSEASEDFNCLQFQVAEYLWTKIDFSALQ